MRQSRRFRGILVSAVTTAALAIGALGVAAAPAHAASVTGFGNGTVGVPQTVTANGFVGCGQVSVSAQYSTGLTISSSPATVDGNGNATLSWTPSIAGTVTSANLVSLCGPFALGSAVIATTTTTTTLNAPNVVKVGTATQITVIVQAASPSTYNPTGSVVVKDGSGNTVVTMGLTAGPGTGQSYAYWWWTPSNQGSYVFQATYGGDSSATGSPSAQDFVNASASGGTISLTAPSQVTVGVPVTLVATLVPSTIQGSVGFTVNRSPISASIPIVNGQASYVWTPTAPGNAVLGASYTTNGGASGSTSDNVTIVAGPVQSDVITLIQPGYGTWAPNGTYPLGNGTTFVFQASTLSGAAVSLTDVGPCQTPGLGLVVTQGSGQCTLTASSPGGNGYGPVRQTYTVTMVPGNQTAALAAPLSGNVNVGKTITLETATQGQTNADQPITWKITNGKGSVCSLVFPSSGAVKLKLKKKGYCTVKARASAVPGQWSPFSLVRSYKGV